MAINYATKYSSVVDEKFALGNLTQGAVNNNYDWEGVSSVVVYGQGTASMNDYSLSGTSRYGTPTDLDNTIQTLTLSKDRSFTYPIDKKTRDDTAMATEVGASLARQIREVVTPEVDAYRLAAMATGAGYTSSATPLTSSNAYSEFLLCNEQLDDAKVPAIGRISFITPAAYNKLKLDDSFVKRGDMATEIAMNGLVGEVDGVFLIKVPTSYMPDVYTDFIITHPVAMVSPIKLYEMKVHDEPQGISGWLVEGRIRYDAFVLTNKADAIAVHINGAA